MVKDRLGELQARSKYANSQPSTISSDAKSDTTSSQKTASDGDESRPLRKSRMASIKRKVAYKLKLDAIDKPPPSVAIIMKDMPNKQGTMAAFMERYASVAADIDTIASNVGQMEKLYRKILNSTYRVESDELQIERITEQNKRLGQSVQRILKEDQLKLQSVSATSDDEGVKIEQRMCETQLAAQSRRFYSTWNEYNRVKLDFRERSRRMLIQRARITNCELDEQQIEEKLDNGQLMKMFGADHMEQERIAKAQLDELQSRHNEFLKLEASIREVHGMFMDIAMLVESQGDMIDSIERHVMTAAEDVSKGRQQLQSAEKTARRSRKMKLIAAAIGLFLLLIVILVVIVDFGLV